MSVRKLPCVEKSAGFDSDMRIDCLLFSVRSTFCLV
jgi:hypothetical protein